MVGASFRYSCDPNKAKGTYWEVQARLAIGALKIAERDGKPFETLMFVGCADMTTFRIMRVRMDLSRYRFVFVDPEMRDGSIMERYRSQPRTRVLVRPFDVGGCFPADLGKTLVLWDAFVGLDAVSPYPGSPDLLVRLRLDGSMMIEHYAHTTVAMRVVN